MGTLLATRPTIRGSDVEPDAIDMPRPSTRVELLVCGSADRGDDGAPIVAMGSLGRGLADDVAIRAIDRLDIDDLLAVPTGAGVVVIDTVQGIDPGWVIQIPFAGLVGRGSEMVLRSSRALAVPGTIGLASMIHGRPMAGIIVVIGGINFGFGDALSWPVVASLGTYRLSILDAIERVRCQAALSPRAAGSR
jgi:hypothetical protein